MRKREHEELPRSLVDLEAECIQKGIKLPEKYGKRDLEQLLLDYWHDQMFDEISGRSH